MRVSPLSPLSLGLVAFLASCGASPSPPTLAPVHPVSHLPDVELVESTPLETTLDHADVPNAANVWLDMVHGATRSIDLAEFYVSDEPGSRLHAVLEEIERAAARGVHVRLLVDETFYKKYPEVPDAWKARPNMEVRHLDLQPGVLHAKYFVVDEREAYVGSQNFDWRSLDHIFEIGARVRTPNVVATLERVFQADWGASGGNAFRLDDGRTDDKLDGAALMVSASPKKLVPASLWDLPRLLAWMHDTTSALRVEVLTYKTKNRDGSDFHELDDAMRAAAQRGVHVELLVSTWGENDPAIEALARVPNVEVRVLVIPPFSKGEIPFARIAHAKYAIFDEGRAWIGTSNWEGDYFMQSRNVGLFFEHGDIPSRLARMFSDLWRSPYARAPSP